MSAYKTDKTQIISTINQGPIKDKSATSENWLPSRLLWAIAALGCWPSNTISCIHVGSHWHWYSFLYSLSYHDHVYICALAQPYTHCRCLSLLSSDNKCLTSYSSSYFSMTIEKWQLQAPGPGTNPHAPPRLPWSSTRPRFLRLLWSTLPITVVGSRQPYRSSGEALSV